MCLSHDLDEVNLLRGNPKNENSILSLTIIKAL